MAPLRLIGGPRIPGPRDWLFGALLIAGVIGYAVIVDGRVAG